MASVPSMWLGQEKALSVCPTHGLGNRHGSRQHHRTRCRSSLAQAARLPRRPDSCEPALAAVLTFLTGYKDRPGAQVLPGDS